MAKSCGVKSSANLLVPSKSLRHVDSEFFLFQVSLINTRNIFRTDLSILREHLLKHSFLLETILNRDIENLLLRKDTGAL